VDIGISSFVVPVIRDLLKQWSASYQKPGGKTTNRFRWISAAPIVSRLLAVCSKIAVSTPVVL
jgi:hypothetical protein